MSYSLDVLACATNYALAVEAYKVSLEELGHVARPDLLDALRANDALADAMRRAERALCHAATGGQVITAPTAPGAIPCPVN